MFFDRGAFWTNNPDLRQGKRAFYVCAPRPKTIVAKKTPNVRVVKSETM